MIPSTDWTAIPVAAAGHFAAIADVHGHSQLLKRTFERLDAALPSGAEIVLLGDLIDRGPDSLGTLDIAMAGCGGRTMHAIAGNHESILASAIHDPDPDAAFGAAFLWVRNGGSEVLEQAGASGFPSGRELRNVIGEERVAFIASMTPHHRSGNVLFAHAGLDPERGLAEQLAQTTMDLRTVVDGDDRNSMRWVRAPWVGFDRSLADTPIAEDLFVVYGHTIQPGVLLTRCQAGIDLGAFRTGILCSIEVDHDRMRFHFTDIEPEARSDFELDL